MMKMTSARKMIASHFSLSRTLLGAANSASPPTGRNAIITSNNFNAPSGDFLHSGTLSMESTRLLGSSSSSSPSASSTLPWLNIKSSDDKQKDQVKSRLFYSSKATEFGNTKLSLPEEIIGLQRIGFVSGSVPSLKDSTMFTNNPLSTMQKRYSTSTAGQVNVFRPLSPHLPIYKPQLSSTLSISNRISGAYLTAAILVPYLFLKVGSVGFTYNSVHQLFFYSSKLGPITLELGALALTFHVYCGIRHLLADFSGLGGKK